MHTRNNLRRLAGIVAVTATTVGGLAAAAPAGAATGPTATLNGGVVTITGTAARDVISIAMDTNTLVVDFGADGIVDAQFLRPRYNELRVLAGQGNDGVSVTGTGDVPVTISGGAGNDGMGVIGNIGKTGAGDAATTLRGDGGNDNLLAATPGPVTVQAGAGDDRVDGGGAGTGRESVSLGDGNDRFVSSLNTFVGARSDTVDGGTGQNSLEMDGTFASESVSLSASAGHLIVDHELRDRIDADNIQDVTYFGFGGLDESGSGDAIAVNDLSGTDVARFTPNFSAPANGSAPNNSADQLTVRGTAGVDHITVSGSGANTTVAGLTTTVTPVLLHSDDFLRIETGGGNDIVDSSGLQRGLVNLQVL
jgi:hypothetical protein